MEQVIKDEVPHFSEFDSVISGRETLIRRLHA